MPLDPVPGTERQPTEGAQIDSEMLRWILVTALFRPPGTSLLLFLRIRHAADTSASATTRPHVPSRQPVCPRLAERCSQQPVKEMRISGRTSISLSQQIGSRQDPPEGFPTFPTVTLRNGHGQVGTGSALGPEFRGTAGADRLCVRYHTGCPWKSLLSPPFPERPACAANKRLLWTLNIRVCRGSSALPGT